MLEHTERELKVSNRNVCSYIRSYGNVRTDGYRGILGEAREMFEEMDLEWDLEQLEKGMG